MSFLPLRFCVHRRSVELKEISASHFWCCLSLSLSLSLSLPPHPASFSPSFPPSHLSPSCLCPWSPTLGEASEMPCCPMESFSPVKPWNDCTLAENMNANSWDTLNQNYLAKLLLDYLPTETEIIFLFFYTATLYNNFYAPIDYPIYHQSLIWPDVCLNFYNLLWIPIFMYHLLYPLLNF